MWKFNTRLLWAIAIFATAATSGCYPNPKGAIYNTKSPQKGAVVFEHAADTNGAAQATMPGGERCEGRFNTVPDKAKKTYDGGAKQILEEETQAGLLVLTCGQAVVACNFTRDLWAAGHGTCKDSRGEQYELLFQ